MLLGQVGVKAGPQETLGGVGTPTKQPCDTRISLTAQQTQPDCRKTPEFNFFLPRRSYAETNPFNSTQAALGSMRSISSRARFRCFSGAQGLRAPPGRGHRLAGGRRPAVQGHSLARAPGQGSNGVSSSGISAAPSWGCEVRPANAPGQSCRLSRNPELPELLGAPVARPVVRPHVLLDVLVTGLQGGEQKVIQAPCVDGVHHVPDQVDLGSQVLDSGT